LNSRPLINVALTRCLEGRFRQGANLRARVGGRSRCPWATAGDRSPPPVLVRTWHVAWMQTVGTARCRIGCGSGLRDRPSAGEPPQVDGLSAMRLRWADETAIDGHQRHQRLLDKPIRQRAMCSSPAISPRSCWTGQSTAPVPAASRCTSEARPTMSCAAARTESGAT
jgi:hypothetical protein